MPLERDDQITDLLIRLLDAILLHQIRDDDSQGSIKTLNMLSSLDLSEPLKVEALHFAADSTGVIELLDIASIASRIARLDIVLFFTFP